MSVETAVFSSRYESGRWTTKKGFTFLRVEGESVVVVKDGVTATLLGNSGLVKFEGEPSDLANLVGDIIHLLM